MKVYILIQEDDDYCGYFVVGVYKTREAAERHVESRNYQDVIEEELLEE